MFITATFDRPRHERHEGRHHASLAMKDGRIMSQHDGELLGRATRAAIALACCAPELPRGLGAKRWRQTRIYFDRVQSWSP